MSTTSTITVVTEYEDVADKRVTTSAVSDITVAEVRKSLALIRKRWDSVHTDPKSPPMYPSDDIGVRDMSIEDFALRFVVGHHSRRSAKSKKEID